MSLARSQKGLSMLGWVAVLALVAFFASAAFKMLPHYFDYMSIDKIITDVEAEPSLDIRSVRDFYEHVSKGMQVNGIRDISMKDVIKAEVQDGELRVQLDYERREPLIRNLDLVANFTKDYRLRLP